MVDTKLIKLDIGCGRSKADGYKGIDICALPEVDFAHDLLQFPWPILPESVEEARCSHFFEHVPAKLRGPFMQELYRILIPDGKCMFITPSHTSSRAFQDPTHEWPPIAPASYLYFNKKWLKDNRLEHAHPWECNFDFGYSWSMGMEFGARNEESRSFAIAHYWEV